RGQLRGGGPYASTAAGDDDHFIHGLIFLLRSSTTDHGKPLGKPSKIIPSLPVFAPESGIKCNCLFITLSLGPIHSGTPS
ncbi:MAG TPA: hypothetical protein VEG25_08560, partial [Burkholderiales bacterium]|nr:hypothetical protein [Burkholderiales bacterium]